MNAELAARMTSARAVLMDFRREDDAFVADDSYQTPVPDYGRWASRLAAELHSVLTQLDVEKPDPAAGQLAQTRLVLEQVLGDEHADRQYALEQIDDILRSEQ